MALRVTRPADRLSSPRERAADAIARGDLAAFRELFAATAGEPLHPRNATRRELLQIALQGPPSESRHATALRFAAAAEAAVGALEDEPREPLFLNLAGVALYELGSCGAAEALFRAAERLDPTLPHVRANLAALAACRRAGGRPNIPAAVATALPALARRAERCAAVAEPARGMTLSLCMIVRDEEEMLPRSLAAARGAVDEIVVVDTGSTDLDESTRAAYGAWLQLASGIPAAPVAPAAAAVLGVAFEALLRVEELDAVAPVLAAIEGSALPERARRELLGNVYLRRGFLESAAEEWMAVCQGPAGPDADALVGLAQVAWGLGEHEDAVVFADEAEGLDPRHAKARRLACRLAGAAPVSSSV